MLILIPLGGVGSRFSQNGYSVPKSLIKVMGKPIIYWLLDNLQIQTTHTVFIPYNKTYVEFRFEDVLRKQYPHISFEFFCLKENTRGAAETICQALCHYKEEISGKDQPVLCVDGDNFYTTDIISQWQGSNSVFTFIDQQEAPIYSYVYTDQTDTNRIINIVEKEKISNNACTGAYGFASWHMLQMTCQTILDKDIRQKGEFYTSTVIQEMLRDNVRFANKTVDSKNYVCLGTPIQVRLFCHNYPRYNSLNNACLIKPKRYCFDLDNTLVTFPTISGDYTSVNPIKKNIEFLKYLKRFGHTIIIYTARRMKTHHGNTGKLLKDIGKITFDTLDQFDIPYDEIYFGKPEADAYIDDLAINCFHDMEKELGYYETMIKPRDFNTIRTETIQFCRKESDNLDGEIYYYQNIPPCVKDMFPIMLDYDVGNKWYSVEKINGITASTLYLSELLTEDQLKHMMNSLYRLQNSVCIETMPIREQNDHYDILDNYIPKMRARYSEYDYSRFPNHLKTFESICDKFKKYHGVKTVIHGDPVFTNILINDYGKIKYIDMRGKVHHTLTIYGDRLYDWAKMYQSLIGYDEIHEGKQISAEYKEKMIRCFETYIQEQFDGSILLDDVKTITQCLFFSLIPLHDNEKCEKYYDLIHQLN
jgi:capsule biosynthesis phosphatase